MRNLALLPIFETLRTDLAAGRCTYDLHAHSSVTDGRDAPEAMAAAARDAGITIFALTEHVRRDSSWFPAFADRCAALSGDGLRVLVGCETKALDGEGTIDASDETLARVDIVLGSVHRVPDEAGRILEPRDLAPDRLLELEHRAAVGLLRGGNIDVLAHQGGMYRRGGHEYPDRLLDELIDLAVEHEVALEVSAKYHRDPSALYARLARRGALIAVGSDAHGREEVGRVVAALGCVP